MQRFSDGMLQTENIFIVVLKQIALIYFGIIFTSYSLVIIDVGNVIMFEELKITYSLLDPFPKHLSYWDNW